MYAFAKSFAISVNSFAKDLNVSIVWEGKMDPIMELRFFTMAYCVLRGIDDPWK